MRKKYLFSIKYKLMLIMLIVLLATVGIIAWISVSLIEDDKTVYIYDLNASVARIFSRQIELILQNRRDALEGFLSAYVSSRRKVVVERDFLKENPDLVAVSIWRLKENRKGGQSSITMEKWLFNESRFDKKMNKSLVEIRAKYPLNLGSLSEERSMLLNSTFSEKLPVFTIAFQSKKFSNIMIVGDFTGALLKDLFSQADVYEAYIVSTGGELVAHPSAARLFAHEKLLDLEVVKLISGQTSVGGLTEYRSRSGETMLAAFSILPAWEVGVIIEVPKKLAFVGARNLIRSLFQIFGFIVAVALIVIVFFSRSLSMPIIRLSEATKEIAKGRFNTRIRSKSFDEIGLLADDFNTMGGKLDELAKQLIQSTKMASIGAIARSIGHEFGNVMEGIIGHADLILMEESMDEAKKRASVIINGAEQANMIIQNLKGISKSEEKIVNDASILSPVKSAILLAEPEYRRRGLTIEKNFECDSIVSIDERQISQVFLNMLINGGHAMERGGKMQVSIFEENGTVHIAFKDTGHGIDRENIERIFEPLFTTKGDRGTGIGLSVSKNIVNDHGGAIRVESELQNGTTFFIELPVQAGA